MDNISEMQAQLKQQSARLSMRDATIKALRDAIIIKEARIMMLEEITEKNRMRTLDAQEEYRHG